MFWNSTNFFIFLSTDPTSSAQLPDATIVAVEPTDNGFTSLHGLEEESFPELNASRPGPSPSYPAVNADILSRDNLVTTFSVASTKAAGAGIKLLCPFSEIRNYDPIWQVMKYFMYIAWDAIDIKILVSGVSSTLRGAMRVSAHTHMVAPITSNNVWNADMFRGSTIPSVVIPFNRKDMIELSIPWNYNQPMFLCNQSLTLDANRYQTPTMLSFTVDQALGNTTDTVCSLTYSIYMSFRNPRLFDPGPSLGGAPAKFAATSITDTLAYSFITGATGRVEEAASKSKEGILTGATRQVAEAASAMSSLPVVGPLASAISGVASTASAVARFLNWDKPTSVDFASYTTLRIGDHLLSTSGLDPSAVINVDPTAGEDITPALFGMDHDGGNVNAIASAYSLLKIGTYLSTASDGDALIRFPVNPGLAVVNATPLNSSTNLSWISQFFNYWRGDLRYRLTFHCDIFTNANVIVCLCNATPATVASTTSNLYRTVVTKVTGATVIEFTVPYHNYREWSVVRQSATEDTPYSYYIGVYLATAATRSGVKCNLDWTLEVASDPNPDRFQLCEPSDHKFYAHGDHLLGGSPQSLGNVTTAMVPVHSLRELFRRYSFINPIPYVGTGLIWNPGTSNPMSWWLHRYVGFRGSLRMTFYVPPNTTMYAYSSTPNALNPGATPSGICGTIYKDSRYNPETSLEIHLITDRMWSFLPAAGTPFSDHTQAIQLIFSPVLTADLPVLGAIGDDFFAGIYAPLANY